MQGKSVLITGPTNGIGLAAARALAEKGASLTLLCRDAVRGEALCNELETAANSAGRPQLLIADFADLSSVRLAAEQFRGMWPVSNVTTRPWSVRCTTAAPDRRPIPGSPTEVPKWLPRGSNVSRRHGAICPARVPT